MSLANRVNELSIRKPTTFEEFLDWLEPDEHDAAVSILSNRLVQHAEVADVFAAEYPGVGNFHASTVGSWRKRNGVTR